MEVLLLKEEEANDRLMMEQELVQVQEVQVLLLEHKHRVVKILIQAHLLAEMVVVPLRSALPWGVRRATVGGVVSDGGLMFISFSIEGTLSFPEVSKAVAMNP